MIKLMKLELKCNNISTYVIASIIACAVLIAFTYFVASVAQVTHEPDFQNYDNIFRFAGTITLIIFSILSAVMYVRFVLNEYTGKKVVLLFSYPVSRTKILLAKLMVVFVFITIAMFICSVIPLAIFSVSESISPIVKDTLSAGLFASAVQTILVTALAVGCIGLVSMRIGFIKRSVPVTLITAFILAGVLGNAVIGAAGNILLGIFISGVTIIAAMSVIIELVHKVNRMEVE